jgi:hypothetical protein
MATVAACKGAQNRKLPCLWWEPKEPSDELDKEVVEFRDLSARDPPHPKPIAKN